MKHFPRMTRHAKLRHAELRCRLAFTSHRISLPIIAILVASLIASSTNSPALAQEEPADDQVLKEEAYLQPPQPILDQVTAPWHENISLSNVSPNGVIALEAIDDGMVSLERMSAPYVILGEQAIDHVALRSRSLSTRSDVGYRIHSLVDDKVIDVQVPEGARVSGAKWSPDGNAFAFLAHFAEGTYLYLADCETGETKRVSETQLLATFVTSFDWSLDGKSIAAVFLPEGVEAPQPSSTATEPKVRVARQGLNASRTYRFLLDTPADKALLEYLATGQLASVSVENGEATNVGEPQMYTSIDMSPVGDAFRVTMMLKPFSYFEPQRSFGTREDLISPAGELLYNFSERKLGESRRPNSDDQDDEDGEEEKRSITWRPDGKGLSFLQKEPKPKPAADEKGDASDQDAPANDDDQGAAADDAKDDDAPQDDESSAKEKKEVKQKDRVMRWFAPYGKDDVEVVYESEHDIQQVQYSQDGSFIFLTQTIERRRTITAVRLDQPEETLVIFQAEPARENGNAQRGRRGGGPAPTTGPAPNRRGGRRNPNANAPNDSQDDTKAADDGKDDDGKDDKDAAKKERGVKRGSLMTDSTAAGDRYVRVSKTEHVYFTGSNLDRDEEATDADAGDDDEDANDAELPKPYIVAVDIKSGEVDRVYVSEGEMLESIASFVMPTDESPGFVLVIRQMHDIVPNTFRIQLGGDDKSGTAEQLTHNQDYAPWMHKLEKVHFQVERVDGFKFWVTAYRNPDFGMKLPAMFWFYPREYDDQEAYDRSASRSNSPAFQERFQRPSTRSMVHLTQIGYVVVEPDCPIVGPSGEWNDNYVPDLRNNLWAVVDAMDKKEWIDRDRLAIGGHSYGAFGTANALAHTPFFKAGIAGDGNYNRTLTPMSFQREPRHLWNAREVYTQMSPLFWVDQIHGALLMYHGSDDANVGTWPINSERMFQALDGVGKPAALYMYPYEAHGPIGKETQLDMWSRWIEWLDIYVKHPERGRALGEKKEETEDGDDGERKR